MEKKKILIVVSVIAIAIIAIFAFHVIKSLSDEGYAYYGDVWETSPERALQKAADRDLQTKGTLTPKIHFKKIIVDDIVSMTFLSESDTLVTVTFVSNEDGLYSVYGYTEEVFLDEPTEFLLNGDPDQFILFPYDQYNNTVWGWCYSNAKFKINGNIPKRETFEFAFQEKKWSIDFWWIDDMPPDTDIRIEYIN